MLAPALCVLAMLRAPDAPRTPRPAAGAAAVGDWGGAGLSVHATASGAKILFDAAQGAADGPLLLDADGRFDVGGTLARDRPGPTRDGEPAPPAQRVRYRGAIAGDTLTLEIVFPGSATPVGPLKAVRGAPARLRKMA